MRKLSSILLLTCLGFSLLGYQLIYHFQVSRTKAEMKAFLRLQKEHKDVVEFRFTKTGSVQPQWEEKEEFRLNGEMYDVIEQTAAGDQLIIRCIPDKKETQLLHIYQKQNERNRSTVSLWQLITAFILPSAPSMQPSERTVSHHFSEVSFSLPHVAAPVFLPPPRCS